MVKKISVLALAGLLAVPGVAAAGGSADLEAKIAELTRQLQELKAQVEANQENVEEMDERSEAWDLASRIQISGDVRSRVDFVNAEVPTAYTALNVAKGVEWFTDADSMSRDTWANNVNGPNALGTSAELLLGFGLTEAQAEAQLGQMFYGDPTAVNLTVAGGAVTGKTITGTLLSQEQRTRNLVAFMKTFTPAQRAQLFASMGYSPTNSHDQQNDTIWTTRMRLNLRAKATENIEFKGRLAMYKAWGMQSNPVDSYTNNGTGGGPFMLSSMSGMDGATTRQPQDNVLRVDRAFVNWNNIGGYPIWFSIGRRPTSDGPPAHLRMGMDARMATPVEYMDYPFDGISMGYAYRSLFGIEDFPGRVRFCYGRGFESGPTEYNDGVKDTDFMGLSWDIYKKGNRFANIQSFLAMNMFNVPDGVTFANPIEYAAWLDDPDAFDPLDSSQNMILDRANLGDIYHTSGVYMDKVDNLNYFLVGGWSRTDPRGVDEMGTGLLSSWWDDDYMDEKDGYSVFAGIRYDMPDYPVKLGLEYNWGSKYWISFTPGHDDLYASKLATRGSVYEAYAIWDIPAGEAISKYGKAFMRLGYQHYDYKYTGSGFWLGTPVDIDELASDPLNAQFYAPTDTMDQVYLTFEATF